MKLLFLTIIRFIFMIGAVLWSTMGLATNAASPNIVVSITPFYALVAYVMQGIGTPQLLVKNGASPHQYAIKPSEMKLLAEANIIFWAGPDLETFLIKPLSNLREKPNTSIVELSTTPGLLLLPMRQSPNFDPHHAHHHGEDHHHTNTDMHFWLDPSNAILLTDAIVKTLGLVDPIHLNIYQQNAEKLKVRLHAVEQNILQTLAPIKGMPFVVFHDAYQYFEHHFGLNGVGAITLHPEVPPSAKRLAYLRQIVNITKARCIFTEPQFQPKLVQSITQDLKVKTGVLDPIGQALHNNPEGYFQLLEDLADSLRHCLKP